MSNEARAIENIDSIKNTHVENAKLVVLCDIALSLAVIADKLKE